MGFFRDIMRARSIEQQTEQAFLDMIEYVKPEAKEYVVMVVLQRLRERFTPTEVNRVQSSPVMAQAADFWAHMAGIGFVGGAAEYTGEQLPASEIRRLTSDAEVARDQIASAVSRAFANWGKMKVEHIQDCLCYFGPQVAIEYGRDRGNRAAQEPILVKNPYPNRY